MLPARDWPSSRHHREQLPLYEPPRPPPSYNEDRQNRLKEIDKQMDFLVRKREEQMQVVYDKTCKTVLDTARHTLKHWNRVLANYGKRPGESDHEYKCRKQEQGLTEDDYWQSKANHDSIQAHVKNLEDDYEDEVKTLENIEIEIDALRTSRARVTWDLRNAQSEQCSPSLVRQGDVGNHGV